MDDVIVLLHGVVAVRDEAMTTEVRPSDKVEFLFRLITTSPSGNSQFRWISINDEHYREVEVWWAADGKFPNKRRTSYIGLELGWSLIAKKFSDPEPLEKLPEKLLNKMRSAITREYN